ncbi:hypothetical protein B0H10DRAFT_1986636 [Mycena sp. CBHHK59/15]|nr:hypothetical protein B0H10DRAFT_1986636 [Mycena sp. CBHHK59/15]
MITLSSGGTAGCCLASRLSEDPSVSVLVLEGGRVHDAWRSLIPLISSDVTSHWSTEPSQTDSIG